MTTAAEYFGRVTRPAAALERLTETALGVLKLLLAVKVSAVTTSISAAGACAASEHRRRATVGRGPGAGRRARGLGIRVRAWRPAPSDLEVTRDGTTSGA